MTVALVWLWLAAVAPQGSACDRLADSAAAARTLGVLGLLPLAQRIDNDCEGSFRATLEAGRGLSAGLRAIAAQPATRDMAERLLRRAVALQQQDARAWFELGRFWRYRYGVTFDAQRALTRAERLADRARDTIPPSLRAEIVLERARGIQQGVNRTRWLRQSSQVPVSTPACGDLGPFCENFTFPGRFNQLLRDTPERREPYQSLRNQLLDLYRRALSLEPSLAAAQNAYAREHALAGEWAPLLAFAPDAGRYGPSQPWWRVVAATALYRLGRLEAADSAFRAAVPRLPDSLARWFSTPPPEMPPDWANRARPLWLTANELQLEYWSRLTLAHLVFSDEEAGVEGLDTPQGDALMRYGWPQRVTQIARDDSRVMSTTQTEAVNQTLSCLADVERDSLVAGRCEMAMGSGYDLGARGGRWIFWTYDANRPSLIFESAPLPHDVPQLEHEGAARDYAERLHGRTPFTFRPAVTSVAMPVQVVRFRGPSQATTLVRLYAEAPAHRRGTSDSLVAGVFVFGRSAGLPLVYSRHLDREAARRALIYDSVLLASGDYAYSVEVLAPRARTAAVARDTLLAPAWPPESLLISDVLIARNVAVAGGGHLTWSDLTVTPNPTLRVRSGDQFWAVWETYGLRRGPDGVATYQVALSHSQTERWHARVLRLLRLGLARPAQGAVISWTAEYPLGEHADVILEAAAITLPDQASGPVDFTLTVTEPSSGRAAHRSFRVVVEGR